MKLTELVEQLTEHYRTHGDGQIVGIRSDGTTFSLRDTKPEYHSDADGGTTHWVLIEEN